MKFSIIVPIYNVSKYVRKCISSILEQSYSDYELILVDDGSTDSSGKICDEFAGVDGRIKVIHKKNGGLVSARKAGCEQAIGEYILNVDGDDSIQKGFLDRIAKEIEEAMDPDMLVWGYTTVGKGAEEIRLSVTEPGIYTDNRLEDLRRSFLYDPRKKGLNSGSIIFSIWTKAVKRSIYKKCQYCVSNEIVHGEDLILTFLLLQQVEKVVFMNYAGYEYRCDNMNSIMSKHTERDFQRFHTIADELYRFFGDNEAYRNQINVYLFCRMLGLLIERANETLTYKKFIEYIHYIDEYGILKKCNAIKLGIQDGKGIVLLSITKYKLWPLLYYFVKSRNKKIKFDLKAILKY